MPVTEKLSDAEEKFFSSKGEVAPPDAPEPQAEPEAPVTPEPAKGAAPEPGKADGEKKGDPAVALREERERRKQAEKERADEREARVKLETRLKTVIEMAQAAQQPKPPEPQIPDPAQDLGGHLLAKQGQAERELQELRNWRQQQEQQATLQTNVTRIAQIALAQEADYRKTNTDYDAASMYLRSMRDAQLANFPGYEDPGMRQQVINQEAINIAATALAAGKNPAEVIYAMAKASGYKTPETPAPNGNGQGEAAAKLQQANNAVSETQKVLMAAAGQQAGQSLGQVNGAAASPLTAESILSMTDEEFASATKGRSWETLVRQLTGEGRRR